MQAAWRLLAVRAQFEVEDEEVLAYELGAKMSLLEGAAELNFAAFRMEYDNL